MLSSPFLIKVFRLPQKGDGEVIFGVLKRVVKNGE